MVKLAKARREAKDLEWRNHILDATSRCLSARGFHDTTIDDISRASMTPRSVLYRYFPNKDALLAETVLRSSRQNWAIVSSLINEASPGPGAVERLIEIMIPIFTVPSLFDRGRFNVEWWAWAVRTESGIRSFRETWREWREGLAAVIRSEVGDEPSDETVQAMANLMLALYNGLLLHATLEGDELDIEAIMRLQQDGWAGIFERAKGAQEEEAPGSTRRAGAERRRATRRA